jgi:hypothetical protein
LVFTLHPLLAATSADGGGHPKPGDFRSRRAIMTGDPRVALEQAQLAKPTRHALV